MKRFVTSKAGFTFIEVLVAMLIFVMAVIASINMTGGSVRATRDTKEITTATWLLQNVMVELETKLDTEGVDKGCDKKKEGKFDAPYDKYNWTTYCDQIDFNISQTAAKLAKDQGKEDDSNDNREDVMQKMILQTASDYLSKSLRELHSEVRWNQGKTVRVVEATTHWARYDLPLSMPGVSGGTTGTTGTTGQPGATTGTGTSGATAPTTTGGATPH
jgi:type II secretion system protein I